ncbi:MAG: molybdenum cofactor biosynthesis protein B [Rhodospirillaceae bacterium]|jgi:molybdenum cofactor biosynthesis protein B|nr:molybdenum cofactor biosynthesis protein B [Rhodospirillaceae bacterium]
MGHADKDTFLAVNIAVLTVSDTRAPGDDRSGDTLVERLESTGHKLRARDIVKDEIGLIAGKLRQYIDDPEIDVVIATGGTGLTGRDVTPEALAQVAEKDIPGFGEMFRMIGYQKIKTSTIQSRAAAGVAGGTYLFAVPGSPGACKDAWDEILVHQLDIRTRPCNFVEMMSRLKE